MNTIKQSPSLIFCILMDAIGYLSFTIPGVCEFADIIWAPISATIFAKTFGGTKGILGGMFNFFEEILPGTDVIPSFTIMWILTNKTKVFKKDSNIIHVQPK